MGETNYIVLEFTKDSGEQYSMKLAYPKLPAVGSDVKTLGEFIVTNNIFTFNDGQTLASFQKALVQTITETPINLEA